MACCAPGAEAETQAGSGAITSEEEVLLASRRVDDGLLQTDFSVPTAHCGACIAAIEGALCELKGVVSARLNLSTRRVSVIWKNSGAVPGFTMALARAGYQASLFSIEEGETDPESGALVRATAVAGFAAMNIMLLSVSVWAGADEATTQAFHMISALIALPAVAFSGRVFFTSAWASLRRGRTNMDVPVSIGILLTLALSTYDTLQDGPHAYFDAVTTLLFFLLIGRTLDSAMRSKARTAVLGLARMMPRGATIVAPDGARTYSPISEIHPGATVLVAPGERVPLDGTVVTGNADLDAAVVTGEEAPIAATPGSAVLSGMLNINGSLKIEVERSASDSFVSDMMRMMEAAEHARSRYRRIADQAASLYSPVVHALAAVAFVSWLWAAGDWHRALTIAVSVLIITCPCALGLAVPMVQVVAARHLFRRGIALKDGSALERLAQIDTVLFDKTGTLTTGNLQVRDCSVTNEDLRAAVALAGRSKHPASRAVTALGGSGTVTYVEDFVEIAGQGIEGRIGCSVYRLGRLAWTLGLRTADSHIRERGATSLTRNGVAAGLFTFSDDIRKDARLAVVQLRDQGLEIEILSGDRPSEVAATAELLGIKNSRAALNPQEKIDRLVDLGNAGRKTLMVGDGLNDAPALAAAHVSMAPGSASDVGRKAADLVFLGDSLLSVPEAVDIAHAARTLIRQNLMMAALYNLFAVPLALTGQVTPILAAAAMSLSSIAVVGNALRLLAPKEKRQLPTAILLPVQAR